MNSKISQILVIAFTINILGVSYSFASTSTHTDYMQLIREKRYCETLEVLQNDTIDFVSPKGKQEKLLYTQLCYFLLGHIAFDENTCLQILNSSIDTYGAVQKSLARAMGKAYVKVGEYKNAQNILEPIVQKVNFCEDSNYVAAVFKILSESYLGQNDTKKALEYGLCSFNYKKDKRAAIGKSAYQILQLYKALGDTIGMEKFEQYCAKFDIIFNKNTSITKYYSSPNYNSERFNFEFFPTFRDTLVYLASMADVSADRKLGLLHEVELIDEQGHTPVGKGSLFDTYMKIAAVYHDIDSFVNEYTYLLNAYTITSMTNKQDFSAIYNRERILIALIQNRLSAQQVSDAFNYYNQLIVEYQSLHGISIKNIVPLINQQQVPLSLCHDGLFDQSSRSRKKSSLPYVFTMIKYGRILSTLYYYSGNYSEAMATEMIITQLEAYYLQYGYQKIPIEFVKYDIDGLLLRAKCSYNLARYSESSMYMTQCLETFKTKYWDVTF